MTIAIRQLHQHLGGEVSGVDLSKPLSPSEVAAIEAGMDRYAVLVFHDQPLTDEQQVAFSRHFGEIELALGGNVTRPEERRLAVELADVSNLAEDNKILGKDDRRALFNLGNQLWHSDSSFRAIPAKYSLLSGRAVPTTGGNTEFADMRAAYDALDDETKAEIEDLICEHSLLYSRAILGFADFTDDEKKTFEPVRQPLVRTHPVTGRKSLFLASHAGTIVGWLMPEARSLLRELTEHATQPAFVHVHEWRQHDLVMWDNRQTMHRVRRFRQSEDVRDMRRTTIKGDDGDRRANQPRLSSIQTLPVSYVNYEFSSKVGIGSNTTSTSSYYSNPNITDLLFRQAAEINWDMNQKLKTGFELSFHNYDLLYNEYYSASFEKDPYAGSNINSIEAALFIQNESEFFNSMKTNIGGRLFYFKNANQLSFEPRISLSLQLYNDFYIKAAAAVANQYLHLITRNDISLPSDLWYPAAANIKLSKSTQFIFGLDKYFDEDSYQTSVEAYYRDMKNLYEFKDSPKINPLNDSIEDQFTSGEGEAYGVEIFIQKRTGKFKGWIGYTLSWTKRKFSELNSGKVFYPKYDRRNDLSFVSTYEIFDRFTCGATFTYATGLRYTLPPGQYSFNPIGLPGDDEILLNYEEVNTSMFPPYHKLDISANYKIELEKMSINLFINLYNVYNKSNAFAQYIVYKEDDDRKYDSST